MISIVIIPARMQSTRLPNKPMLEVSGKPLLWYTYQQALKTKADFVLVTSSDKAIRDYCKKEGISFRGSSSIHPNGTSRCADVLNQIERSEKISLGEIGCIVNWQVDEPLVNPNYIKQLTKLTSHNPYVSTWLPAQISTLVAPLPSPTMRKDVNVVKVVVDNDVCHWFSRAEILPPKQHVGVYAYQPPTLKEIGRRDPTEAALQESLEQLSWIQWGYNIVAVPMTAAPLAINTQDDLQKFHAIIEEGE